MSAVGSIRWQRSRTLHGCLAVGAPFLLVGILATSAGGEPPRPAKPHVDALGDPLPEGALLRLGTVRFQHPDGASTLALSPDGRWLATQGAGTVRIWDAATGRQRHNFPLHHRFGGFFAGQQLLAFSADGQRIIAAGDGGQVFVWDLDSGVRQEYSLGSDEPVHSVHASPDGHLLAASTGQGITLCNCSTGRILDELEKRHRKPPPFFKDRLLWNSPSGLAIFSPDGKTLAVHTSAPAKVVRLYETATRRERQRIDLAAPLVRLAFSPDGQQLAVTERDNSVRLYDTAGGRRVRTWTLKLDNPYENYTSAVAFAPDGKSLAAGATDNRIRVWDVATGRELQTLRGHGWYVTGLAYSPDGRILYSSSWDGTIRRWDVAGGKELPAEVGYAAGVTVAISPDGTRFASAGGPVVHVWDAATGRRLLTLDGDPAGVSALAFSPDGRILAAGDGRLSVHLWDAASGRLLRQWHWPKGKDPHTEIDDLRFAPDGRTLATASFRSHDVRLWDVATGEPRATLAHQMVRGVSFAPDGRTLASGGWDKGLKLWELPSGKLRKLVIVGELEKKQTRDRRIERIAYSPDGRSIAIWYLDGWVGLRDVAWRRADREFKASNGQGRNIACSPDGLWLACLGEDNSIALYEPQSGQVVLQLRGHQGRICGLAFRPDGRALLSGSADNTALLWSLRPPQLAKGGNIETLWTELASANAAAAYRAVWQMAESGDDALQLLAQRLKPVAADEEPPAEDTLRQLRAVAVLQRLGSLKSRAVLERLATGSPSAAQTRQAKAALAQWK